MNTTENKVHNDLGRYPRRKLCLTIIYMLIPQPPYVSYLLVDFEGEGLTDVIRVVLKKYFMIRTDKKCCT